MNTYFVFWEKRTSDGKPPNLEARSLQASEVSACNGELNFWLEVGSTAKDNLVFSVPLANLVDFHIAKTAEIIEKKTPQMPYINRFIERLVVQETNELSETVVDIDGLSSLMGELEKANRWYKATLKQPHTSRGYLSDHGSIMQIKRLITQLEAISVAINSQFEVNARIGNTILENVCRLAYATMSVWLGLKKHEDKYQPHIYIMDYIERCENYQYNFSYLDSPENLLSKFLKEIGLRIEQKKRAFKSINLVCKELRDSGEIIGNFGNNQREIIENNSLVVEKRLILSFLSAIIRGYDND